MNEIERLRALLAEATPGPWRASGATAWKPGEHGALAWNVTLAVRRKDGAA